MKYEEDERIQIHRLASTYAKKHFNYIYLFDNSLEDYISEISTHAIYNFKRYNKNLGSLSSWCYKVFENHIKLLAKRHKYKYKKESYIEDIFENFEESYSYNDNFVDDLIKQDEDSYLLNKIYKIKKVNPAFFEYYLQNKKYRELAKKYGISYQAIQAKVKTSLKKIRKEIL